MFLRVADGHARRAGGHLLPLEGAVQRLAGVKVKVPPGARLIPSFLQFIFNKSKVFFMVGGAEQRPLHSAGARGVEGALLLLGAAVGVPPGVGVQCKHC